MQSSEIYTNSWKMSTNLSENSAIPLQRENNFKNNNNEQIDENPWHRYHRIGMQP